MNGAKTEAVKPSSSSIKKAGVSGMELFEQNLAMGIASKMGSLHYDELVRICEKKNIVYNRVKAIRDEGGKVDVLRTFMHARKISKASISGGM